MRTKLDMSKLSSAHSPFSIYDIGIYFMKHNQYELIEFVESIRGSWGSKAEVYSLACIHVDSYRQPPSSFPSFPFSPRLIPSRLSRPRCSRYDTYLVKKDSMGRTIHQSSPYELNVDVIYSLRLESLLSNSV